MMLKSSRLAAFFAGCLVFLAASWALAFDLEERVIKTRLKNGLTVLMVERDFSPTVSLYIRFRVGAVDEAKGETGAAHFLEHMMFKGTKTIGTKDFAAEEKVLARIEQLGQALDDERKKGNASDEKRIGELSSRLKALQDEHRRFYLPNEIDRLYTQNGGQDMNASTGQDVTTYYISLPANKLELWARIESDRLRNPVFREFYTERDVIMEERRQRVETSPDGALYEAFMAAAYKVHSYGLPILGLPEDLTFMSPVAIRAIHKKYLAAENIVIAVVGDIDPDKTLSMIDRYFGALPSSPPRPTSISPEPPQDGQRRVNISFDANPSMIIGFHKPNAPSSDDYVFDVLETILARGRTSRLYSKLVLDRQIAQSVSAYNGLPSSRYPNLFAIFASPRHPHTGPELEAAILTELDDLKQRPVADEELARSKRQLKMDYIKSLNSNSKLASTLSYYELLMGDYRYFSNYVAEIDKVSAEDIQRAAATYLNETNRTVAHLVRSQENRQKKAEHE
ncbi:MAG TPA: pitrilysin family protein [Smithellaceae bacterium]|nr:pitrilysin family protein [Smithellaceae bacterium]